MHQVGLNVSPANSTKAILIHQEMINLSCQRLKNRKLRILLLVVETLSLDYPFTKFRLDEVRLLHIIACFFDFRVL